VRHQADGKALLIHPTAIARHQGESLGMEWRGRVSQKIRKVKRKGMAVKFTTEDAFNQPGGYQKIEHGDLTVVAPINDIKMCLEWLRSMDTPTRSATLRSVNQALAVGKSSMRSQTASQDVAMQFCQDCALWFANEVLDGRVTL
jgi:hypothetical protein